MTSISKEASAKGPAPGGGAKFCEPCCQSFTTARDFRVHLSTYKHRRAIGCEDEEELKTSEWYCNLCQKYYSTQKELKRHFSRSLHKENANQAASMLTSTTAPNQNSILDNEELDDDDEDDDHQLSTPKVQLEEADLDLEVNEESKHKSQQMSVLGTEPRDEEGVADNNNDVIMEEIKTSQNLVNKSNVTLAPAHPPPKLLLETLSPLESPPPLKQGRGRPPKNKTDQTTTPEAAQDTPKGKRGRPPKIRPTDPQNVSQDYDMQNEGQQHDLSLSPIQRVQEETPDHKAKKHVENAFDEIASTSALPPTALQTLVKRGRGRPSKIKSTFSTSTPVLTASPAAKRGRGRPSKRPLEDDERSRRVDEDEGEGNKTEDSQIQLPIPSPPTGGSNQSEVNEVVNPSPLVEPSNEHQEVRQPVPKESQDQNQSRKFKCVVCNSTFASQYHLDRHFKTRIHAQNVAQRLVGNETEEDTSSETGALTPVVNGSTTVDKDDDDDDIQIVHEGPKKPPLAPSPSPGSRLDVGSYFRWNGKRFKVKEVRHRQDSSASGEVPPTPNNGVNLQLQLRTGRESGPTPSTSTSTSTSTSKPVIHPALALPPGLIPTPTQICRPGASGTSGFPESPNPEVITLDDDDKHGDEEDPLSEH